MTDDDSNIQALKNIASCLDREGLFVVNIQGVHDDYNKPLPGGVVYSQKVIESPTMPTCLEKTFYFKKDGETLIEQTLVYKTYKEKETEDIFGKAGFKLKGRDASGQLFIYTKS